MTLTPEQVAAVLRGHASSHYDMAEVLSDLQGAFPALPEDKRAMLLAVQLGLAESFQKLAKDLGALA